MTWRRIRIKVSPKGNVYVRDLINDQWHVWSPNGEYWESDYGDELSDNQVNEWPGASLDFQIRDDQQ